MTSLRITIDSGDDAMSTQSGAQSECADILRRVATMIDGGYKSGPLYDSNGNRCGSWDFEAPEDDEDDEP